jgi:hypothetical protein
MIFKKGCAVNKSFQTLFFILLIPFLCPLWGASIQKATYEVSFGVLERIGIAETSFEIRDDQSYFIRVEAKTEGIAKILTNNRIEVYESYGMVQDGKLIPKKYVKIRQTDAKKGIKIYTFDHLNKKIVLENIHSDDWKEKPVDYYASEDILTLFFNLKHYPRKPEYQSFYALGGDKKEGKIDVVFADENASTMMSEALQTKSGEFMKVIVNQPIFSSERGELYLNLNEDGFCEKALLKDVLFFGDIVGKRIR